MTASCDYASSAIGPRPSAPAAWPGGCAGACPNPPRARQRCHERGRDAAARSARYRTIRCRGKELDLAEEQTETSLTRVLNGSNLPTVGQSALSPHAALGGPP